MGKVVAVDRGSGVELAELHLATDAVAPEQGRQGGEQTIEDLVRDTLTQGGVAARCTACTAPTRTMSSCRFSE